MHNFFFLITFIFLRIKLGHRNNRFIYVGVTDRFLVLKRIRDFLVKIIIILMNQLLNLLFILEFILLKILFPKFNFLHLISLIILNKLLIIELLLIFIDILSDSFIIIIIFIFIKKLIF